MKKWIFTLFAVVWLIGCSQYESVSKKELEKVSRTWKEPKVAIWYYQGSDKKYHYFKYIDLGITNNYKVSIINMKVREPFPYTKDQKKWRVMPWGPYANRSIGR